MPDDTPSRRLFTGVELATRECPIWVITGHSVDPRWISAHSQEATFSAGPSVALFPTDRAMFAGPDGDNYTLSVWRWAKAILRNKRTDHL